MAYITIEFGGKRTFGGYLSVDGDKQIKLSDAFIIKVDAGTHNLDFMNVPSSNVSIAKMNAYAGNYNTAMYMADHIVEGTITESLDDNDMMTLTVVSDNNGKILDLPTYTITPLTDEGIQELDKLYIEQCQSGRQEDGSSIKVELFLCIFLGWMGAHKFYRRKKAAGFFYLLTLGGFIICWLIDIIRIVVKKKKLKKGLM